MLAVKEGVLIPRPETEEIVDLATGVEGFGDGVWADLGTGSGSIAIGIARLVGEKGRVVATDLSRVAVEVARFNVGRYNLEVSNSYVLRNDNILFVDKKVLVMLISNVGASLVEPVYKVS